MELFNSALGKNISFVRPEYFIISGFVGIPNMKYYYVFLFFLYIVAVLGNLSVMTLICLDHSLRTPKYVAVFNLAFVDLFSSSALVPKVIDIFLFNHYSIPYIDCLMFFFFGFTCYSMQAFNLVALSYDRVVAILYPLHYQVKVTHRFMITLIGSFWFVVTLSFLVAVGFLTRLSFCDSVVINSFFCDHGQIFRLACNDYTPSRVLGNIFPIVVLYFPLVFIVCSYILIGKALAKVASPQERKKALKTCSAHLSLVAIYFLPVLVTFTMSANIDPNARIINLSLTTVFPPMLNPIIYVLQTQEIRASIRKIFKLRSPSTIRVK